MDGFVYRGEPLTRGSRKSGSLADPFWSCSLWTMGRSHSATAPALSIPAQADAKAPFSHTTAIPQIEKHLKSHLIPAPEIGAFTQASKEIDEVEVAGAKLHPAIRYGVSQALLDAVALKRQITKAGVVADENGTKVSTTPIRIYAQTGDERYTNVDKMIVKRVDIIPHGLINNVRDKVGTNGGFSTM